VITILAMGQSNAVGNQTGGAPFPASCVDVWNCRNDIDTTADLGSAWVSPQMGQYPFNTGGQINNMMVHAANWIHETTGEDVRLILVAMGGQSIDKWTDVAGARGALYARMRAVLSEAGVVDPVDVFLWHQGEADNGTSSTYAARFGLFIDNLETDGIIGGSTKVCIGETSPASANILPVIRSLESAQVKVAHLSLLPCAVDGIHFTGASLSEAGRLMAEAARYSMPDVIGFHAVKCVAQSIASSSFVKVTFPMTHWDSGGVYDTANSRFSPPAGRYLISAAFQMSGLSPSGQLFNIAVYKNGQLFKRHYARSSGSTDGNRIEFVDYASGLDSYEVYAYGVGSPVVATAIENTWFQATKI